MSLRKYASPYFVVMGPKGCGKTALMTRLCDGVFIPEDPNQFATPKYNTCLVAFGTGKANLIESDMSLPPHIELSRIRAFIIVYNANDSITRVQAQTLEEELRRTTHRAIILVGTKADLLPLTDGITHVHNEVLVSAKTNHHIAILRKKIAHFC